MTQFEEKVLRDLSELKAHMNWLVGNGNEGKLQEMENRMRRQEASLQRLGGVFAACGGLFMIVTTIFEAMRVTHH